MVTCLVCTTNCVVYYVVPDDHYLDTGYGNNTLQHYLNNSEKYFTSHTKLVLLPGKHHLHTDLIIQDVQNFILQGFNSQEMNRTIIYCTRSAHLLINGSDDIIITSLTAHECGVSQGKDSLTPLVNLHIYNCSNIVLEDCVFVCQSHQCGLVVANVVEDSYLANITSSYLLITHNMTRNNSKMVIRNYHHMGHSSYKYRAIEIFFFEHSYKVHIYLFQIKLSFDNALKILSSTSKGTNMVFIVKMKLTGIAVTKNVAIIVISIINGNISSQVNVLSRDTNTIYFKDCLFANINGKGLILLITDLYGPTLSEIFIKNCRFSRISSSMIIRSYVQKVILLPRTFLMVAIFNTSFFMLKHTTSVLWIENTRLELFGPVIFTKIENHFAIILSINSRIFINYHIIFSFNQAKYCIVLEYITLTRTATLDIISNKFSVVFYVANDNDRFNFFVLIPI